MLTVVYAECQNNPFMLCVVMLLVNILTVVMLSVIAPLILHGLDIVRSASGIMCNLIRMYDNKNFVNTKETANYT
jgi:hypothetical protein